VNSSLPFESSNAGYRTFSTTNQFVSVVSDEQNFRTYNPRVAAAVQVNSSQIIANVTPVVVEESSRIYGYRIPYRNNMIYVAISETLPGNKKSGILRENYVYVMDAKNENQSKSIKEDNRIVNSLIVNRTNYTKITTSYKDKKQVQVTTRRTPTSIQTLIKPVNVIDEANGVYSGSGAGGGGGGGGGITEYWS
jgi:hypothetical protein